MNALAGVRLSEKQRIQRTISVSADDSESLLVSFLSELVFFAEHDQLAFDDFEVSISKGIDQAYLLTASIHGAPILSSDKVIKAVTYHGLQIQKTARGLEVEIVFDV
jgi:SHS2 domain-containing protein